MQASLPTFIDAVKVSDLGLGSTPLRILSMRALPDQPGDPEYPRESWITGDYHQKESQQLREETSGDYVNYEVAFAYQAQPGKTDGLRAHNIQSVSYSRLLEIYHLIKLIPPWALLINSLMIEFFVGVFDWVHIPIPICKYYLNSLLLSTYLLVLTFHLSLVSKGFKSMDWLGLSD
jgi:hypothetical protein